jgi:archaellum component FlaG (FlaF/FlaG flagellin family)
MSCDSTGLPNTKLTLSLCDGESTKPTISQADLEKWAELMALNVTQIQPPPPAIPVAAATPEAWRTDVEALTPDGGRSDGNLLANGTIGQLAGSTASSSDESEQNRVQVRVNAGDLGELSLVVERSKSGLHVRIGAEDSSVLAAMSQNSESVTRALAGIGQPITSLTFVSMDGVGINLAPSQVAMSNRARSSAAKSKDDKQVEDKRRKNRRLDVLG